MKAYFDKDGVLIVEAEDNTEAVALRFWIAQAVELPNGEHSLPPRCLMTRAAGFALLPETGNNKC